MAELWQAILDNAPRILGAVIILFLGWIFGRLFGTGVSKLLQKMGARELLRKTIVGRTLEHSGATPTRVVELLVRWFVYLIAVLAAVDVLNISALSVFVGNVVSYLPSLMAGILILLFGLVIVDFLGDAVSAIGREARIEFAPLISIAVRLFLYLTVIVVALTTMKIDVTILNEFAKAIAWGTAIGIGVGLGIALGWGLKDRVARDIDKWVASAETTVKKTEDFWSWYKRSEEKGE
jgi:hypothetical protein